MLQVGNEIRFTPRTKGCKTATSLLSCDASDKKKEVDGVYKLYFAIPEKKKSLNLCIYAPIQ